MEKIIQEILQSELNEDIHSIQEIDGLGSVNKVFDIKGTYNNYIFRFNETTGKTIEYQKEKWCLDKIPSLGILAPKVLKIGFDRGISYMIQEKIVGRNGKFCSSTEKQEIWKCLGKYARKYQKIKRITNEEVEKNEFHKDWKARLDYNIRRLNENDTLLKNKVLTSKEHQKSKAILTWLKDKDFEVGLVHGDLCPRNVIWSKAGIYLLDWGMAEINVVPHSEIGSVLMSGEANEKEFENFLEGLGILQADYDNMKEEINILNFLQRLDKYRWAESYGIENIIEYEKRIRETLGKIH
jgi:fructosamine-3-kinase